ncbi:TetR/AcrR family transcriptional regulator [Actinomadura kijaniata]|uniref:TetR/AcrR family transcriptional regulator n=1 Tax=Actinomadura kijaniata TaxID=46161 RepID=UPI000833C827|nr:TetR/AcrR family transcriptional regulator [Actinomadura kijaniata]
MSTPRRAPRQAEAERNDRELLRAAREVLAEDGAHASVAAIAARAGVGIGSLYRRYRTKEELFQRLVELSLDQSVQALERALERDDPWEALAGFVTESLEAGGGSLAPIAGSVEITPDMWERNRRADAMLAALVERASAAGVLRPDVTVTDLWALLEQLSAAPMIEQLRKQGRAERLPAALAARRRVVAIVLDGLRAPGTPLPGDPPGGELFADRWARD